MNRIFIDMDGVLAEFRDAALPEELYAKGYFRDLAPNEEVVEAVSLLAGTGLYDMYIMSSFLADSDHALREKNLWLDRYLPEIPACKRIFPPCSERTRKANYVPGGVLPTDVLVDDYGVNCRSWGKHAAVVKVSRSREDLRKESQTYPHAVSIDQGSLEIALEIAKAAKAADNA